MVLTQAGNAIKRDMDDKAGIGESVYVYLDFMRRIEISP
jgi:hypothetical protein